MHQPTVHPKPYTLYPAGQLLVQHPYLWPASGVAGRLADRACAPADSLGAVQGRGAAEEVEAGGGHPCLPCWVLSYLLARLLAPFWLVGWLWGLVV